MLQQQHQKMSCTTELTDDELNHFLNIEIGIPEATIVKLREGYFDRLEDLVEFNSDDVNSIAKDLREPGALVPPGRGTRIAPALVSAPGVRMGGTH